LTGDKLGWRGPWGTTYAPNLRLLVKTLSEDQWLTYARREMRPPMPWYNLRDMSERDLRAIYRYVKHLGPAGEPAPTYLPPAHELPPAGRGPTPAAAPLPGAERPWAPVPPGAPPLPPPTPRPGAPPPPEIPLAGPPAWDPTNLNGPPAGGNRAHVFGPAWP